MDRDAVRFWAKVNKLAGARVCWEWTASLFKTGYGQFSVGGKGGRNLLTHRAAVADGARLADLGRRYGVTYQAIDHIARRKVWTHI